MGKIYTKNSVWNDEVLAGAARYDIKENGGAAFKSNMDIALVTGVSVAGSPFNATRMNVLENGVDAIDTKLADATDLFTTGGTSTAYTITTTGVAALATGEKFRVKFHVTAGATPTLNRDSKGAKSLKFYDAQGNKQVCGASTIFINMIFDIIYDGTDYLLLNISTDRETIYKITPTVASNNLTLTITHADGTTPSAARPLWVKIGNSWRSITAALSVTKNAGTSWCNSGAAELATKEVDYFVYLGYNATDGVVIGFSRIPFAYLYSDFNTTVTNERHCAISTITNAAAGDDYVNIGRFAATLSAGAGYTWTVPTYTTANLIQFPIFETRWLTWVPTNAGFSANPTDIAEYKVIRNGYWINVRDSAAGTSSGPTYTKTLPFTSKSVTNQRWMGTAGVTDNSVAKATPGVGQVIANSSSLEFYIDMIATGWTAANNKQIRTLTPMLIEL